jgi:hypothetical protein
MMPGRKGMERFPESGFGRMEAILSFALLGLMGFSSFYLLKSGKDEKAGDVDMDRGAVLGKAKLDSLRILAYGRISAGCDTVNERFIRRWYVATNLKAENKNVEMLISWPLSARHTLSLNTLIGDGRYKAL